MRPDELIPEQMAADETSRAIEEGVVVGDTRSDERADADDSQLVPGWLALLVLVLLLAVVGVGGYVIRGVMTGGKYRSPAEVEIARFEESVQSDPTSPDAHRSLAFAYQQAERWDDALEEYDKTLALLPKDPASLYNKGIVYLKLGVNDKAEEVLWDVLEAEPTHVLAAKALGEYYASKGQYRSLIKAVRPVVEVKPEMADLQYLMGLAYENTGRPEWAMARYQLALKYVPDMKKARDGLRRLESRK